MLILLLLSEELLTALEGLRSMGLVRCTVKCKHLVQAVLLRMKEVQMTAEEDKIHVLSYAGYDARQELLRDFGKGNSLLRPKQYG
jgi:hypothetical protein